MRHVVVTHAHHAGEGVYRLVFAQAHEFTDEVFEDNPDYDPDEPGGPDNPVSIRREFQNTALAHHQDVVWAADDPRWEGMSRDEIAEAQRREVSEMLTRRAAEQERAEAERQAAHRDLGGAGVEL